MPDQPLTLSSDRFLLEDSTLILNLTSGSYNRKTFCQWEEGPIKDELGVEQGGTKSSEQYKIYNNEQITTPQMSGLGTDVQNVPVAAIGQADDTGLVSNDILQLQHLLQLTLNYCSKYQVELSTAKTKLLAFNTCETEYSKYVKMLFTIHIGETVTLLSMLGSSSPFMENTEIAIQGPLM